MSRSGPLRLATRGSTLARRQAEDVRATLADHRHDVELVEVETTGDRVQDELIADLGTTGAFVRSLDRRILDGDVDGAVHSLKDVPNEGGEGLVVAAVPRRAAANDVLVTPDGAALADLPAGAAVGTSSQRRRAELLSNRPDLDVIPLRGNVDTRIEKLLAPSLQAEHERRLDDDGGGGEEWFDELSEVERRALGREAETEYDAVVLAEAGLRRSGLLDALDYQRLPADEFVPAPGQGALAVTAAPGDAADALRTALDHSRTRVETTVERTILAEVGGGCIAPVGVYAVLRGAVVHVEARVLAPDGDREATVSRDVDVESHADGAREVAADLVTQGAREFIEAAEAEQ